MPDNGSQALGYDNVGTLGTGDYDNPTSYTLGVDEYFDVRFKARLVDGIQGYRVRMVLENGSDGFHLEARGDAGKLAGTDPGLDWYHVVNGSVDSDGGVAATYLTDPAWGPSGTGVVMHARFTTDGSETRLYESSDGTNWTQIGRTLDFGLGSIDNVRLYLNPVGYWGGMDDVKVQVVPEPATMALLGIGGLGLLVRRKRN